MNITQAFDSNDEFCLLLRRLQFPVANVNRLTNEEGISNARTLASMKTKDIETSLTNINRLFGSQTSAARRIYFAPIRVLRVKALSAYFRRCLDANRVPDIRIIDLPAINRLIQNLDIWSESSGDVDDVIKQSKIEFSTEKFTRFRQKMDTVVSSIKGCRGISIDYLTRSVDPANQDAGPIEEASPDVNSFEFMRLNTTHEGPEFDRDLRVGGVFFMLQVS